jgi:uncharacterized phage protein gp47/JayE
MSTSVPAIEWTEEGIVLPQESAILAGVQTDLNAAFGGNLNPDLRSPQGQVATSTAAIIAEKNSVIAQLVDQVDPDNATGFMQDAIARIYFLNRNPGVSTTVQLVCVGALGTIIPVGAQAQDTSGNLYVCTQAGQIPVSGNITLSFANAVVGPIPCPANTVTQIYQAIPGWDTVNNPNAGTVGSNVESAADFEFRRQNSVAANAHGSMPAIYGEVIKVPGVIDAYAFENQTGNPIFIGSTDFQLVPHSFVVSVTGGAAQDIANAIWTKKNEGSDMNGNTTATVVDDSYSYPQPQYIITWEVPTPTQYNFTVNIVNSSALPSTIVQDVQAAVTAQFNGANTNGQRVRIGSLLLAASFYGPVATCEGPSVPVQVLSITIGNTFAGTAAVTNGSKVLTVSAVGSGRVSPGTVISMANVPAGTTVIKQISGTAGSTGTYYLSAAATGNSGSVAVTGTGGTAVLIGVDQQPQIGTITVNLT